MSEQERIDKARRAVDVFRKMQPTLSAFARAITKRSDVKVVMDVGSPRTDGKSIFFRPPIALGEDNKHNRSKCELRDRETLLLMCPACAAREEVLIVIYHEIAHIAFDTFRPPSETQKQEIIQHAVEAAGGKNAAAIAQRIKNAPFYVKGSYLGLSSLVSEYLPVIVNALEDARVNREMFAARPGTKVMFEGWVRNAFDNGVEQSDRSVQLWMDYPLNAQVTVGLFCKAAGYNFERWFQPQVVQALKDIELTNLVNRMDSIRSTSGVYELGFPVLMRLRELGFCRMPEDEDDPPQEPNTPDEEQQDETEPTDEPSDDSPGEDDEPSDSEDDSSGGDNQDPGDSHDDEPSGDPEDEDDSASDGSSDDEGSSDTDESTDEGEGTPDAAGDKDSEDGGSRGDSESEGGEPDDSEPSPDSGSDEPVESDGTDAGAEGSDAGEAEDDADTDSEPSPGGEGSADSSEPTPSEVSDQPGTAPVSGVSDSESDAGQESVDDPSGDPEEPTEPSTDDATPQDEPSDDGEEIDTGADEGKGGTTVVREEGAEEPDYGDPSEANKALKVFGDHVERPTSIPEQKDNEAVDIAIVQGMYFEQPSADVHGVRVHRHDDPPNSEKAAQGWSHDELRKFGISLHDGGVTGDVKVEESVLGPCLLRMRVAFSDNARAAHQHNLKSGRIHGRALGRRAWGDDERLFKKKRLPGKKDYFVIIGIDISGSTTGMNIRLAKRAAMAQAELCHRAGVGFAVYAHTAVRMPGKSGFSLEMYEIKNHTEVWTDKQRRALEDLGPVSDNLDGHSIEYYRKRCDESPATNKIIMYYTDGKMPAANHDEELEILRREIQVCKNKGYLLMGVGIRTDSPIRHGLDTVQVDDDADMMKVVKHLEKKLT